MEPVAALRKTVKPTAHDRLRTRVTALARPYGLMWMGATANEALTQTIVLLGCDADFWPVFTKSPEKQDGAPDPLDRWSTRVLAELRASTGAIGTVFPFGGPPYAPFLKWATETGDAWSSPVGMLVHNRAGLMISYRGALVFPGAMDRAQPPASPCTACTAQPCATACPVDALSAARGYDVAACHAYLDTPDGADCLHNGCKARRACPVSAAFGRDPAQSAFHMAAFHPS